MAAADKPENITLIETSERQPGPTAASEIHATKPRRCTTFQPKSILLSKLLQLALRYGVAVFVIANLTFAVLGIRFAVERIILQGRSWDTYYTQYYLKFLIITLGIVLRAVPIGVPAVVGLALIFAVRKLKRGNIASHHIGALDVMGNATTVCFSKTNCLTANNRTVTRSVFSDSDLTNIGEPKEVIVEMAVNAISISISQNARAPDKSPLGMGHDRIDKALLEFLAELGKNYEDISQRFGDDRIIKRFPFNSSRPIMSTLVDMGDGNFRLYSMGAARNVLAKCNWTIKQEGQAVVFPRIDNESFSSRIIDPMISAGLHTVSVAYKDYVSGRPGVNQAPVVGSKFDDEDKTVAGLTCLCVIGIEETVGTEVRDVMKQLQQAGVCVRIVTGDDVNIARYVAIESGIIAPEDDFLVLSSEEYNRRVTGDDGQLNKPQFDQLWPNLRVLAESSFEERSTFIEHMISRKVNPGEVVALVESNDEPALKVADVAFVMGVGVTEPARNAADVVLKEDDLASLVMAVRSGRHVYDCIAKYIQFQLVMVTVVVLLSVLSALAIADDLVTPLQATWANLIIVLLVSLSFASEAPTAEPLLPTPRGRTKSLVSMYMLKNILGHAGYQLVLLLVLYFEGEKLLKITSGRHASLVSKPSQHLTVVFNTLLMMTMFNQLNCREITGCRNPFRGLKNNLVFIGIWILLFILQIVIIELGGLAFRTAKLTIEQWLWCLFFGIGELVWAQVLISLPPSGNMNSKA